MRVRRDWNLAELGGKQRPDPPSTLDRASYSFLPLPPPDTRSNYNQGGKSDVDGNDETSMIPTARYRRRPVQVLTATNKITN